MSFLGMFTKIFLNGYEFITTTVVMASVPLFYYALKNRWELSKLFYRLVATGGGVILAAIASITILSFQFMKVKSKLRIELSF